MYSIPYFLLDWLTINGKNTLDAYSTQKSALPVCMCPLFNEVAAKQEVTPLEIK